MARKNRLVQFPLTIVRESPIPLQRQLVDQIRTMIDKSILRPGMPLPSVRDLSITCQVSRNTVVLAFQKLTDEGYLATRQGAATEVSSNPPQSRVTRKLAAKQPQPRPPRQLPALTRDFVAQRPGVPARYEINFRLGETSPELFPREIWRHWANLLIRHSSNKYSSYPNPLGLLELRSAIAEHIALTRSIETNENNIVIVNGIQEALTLVAWAFLSPDRNVLMEAPGHKGVANLFQAFGATLSFLPVHSDGVDMTNLPDGEYCLAHITPSHQFPMGVTLSAAQRLDLLAWARKRGAFIIENDYDSDFRYSEAPMPAIMSLDGEQVIYLGTFSKAFGPSLRLGYVICPPSLTKAVASAKALLNNGCSWLEQGILARMMRNGEFDSHLRYIRQCYGERRKSLLKVLQRIGGEVLGSDAGTHIAWKLPDTSPNAEQMEALLREQGIKVYRADEIASSHETITDHERMLFLGFSAVSVEGIEHFGAALETVIPPNKHRRATP